MIALSSGTLRKIWKSMHLIAPILPSRYSILKDKPILLETKKMRSSIKRIHFSKESQCVNKVSVLNVMKLMDSIASTTRIEINLNHLTDSNSMNKTITGSFATNTSD